MSGPRHGRAPASRSSAAGAPTARAEDAGRVRVPRRRWTPGELPFRLELPPAGLVLGTDVGGGSATFPLLVPTQSTRVGIVGEVGLARLLALRLLGQSCDLTVVTHRTEEWQRLAAGVPETPFAIAHQVRRWPLEGTPPPWGLLIDMDDPPPAGFTRSPWSTVVHFAPSVPHGSGWWQSAHLVLTTRAHAGEVTALRPRLDAPTIERLADDDVVAVDHGGVTVFRPSLDPREYGLLATFDRPSGSPSAPVR
jgi:hypothetical protein